MRQIRLDDGRQVLVRPIAEHDTDALRAMHRRLSEESVRRRFLTSLPELSPAAAERFTHVDGRSRVALVAVDGDRIVAVARYDRLADDPAVAELGEVVQDDYQHHSLGTQLLRCLADQARAQGVTRFVADVLCDNLPMLRTLRDAGLRGPATIAYGVYHLELPLQPGQAPSR